LESGAIVPIDYPAAAAGFVVDEGIEYTGQFCPVDHVITDGVSPLFVFVASQFPFVEHIKQMILTFVIDQTGSIGNLSLDGGVVELRAKGLVVMLLIGNLLEGEFVLAVSIQA
jgi:hypothetical protein